MLQIFADLSDMQDDILRIGGSDYNHIRNVLRMRPGEEIAVRALEGTAAGKAVDTHSPETEGTAGRKTERTPDIEAEGAAGRKTGRTPDTEAGNTADSDEYRFEIVEYTDSEVVCRLRFIRHAQVELPVRVLLFQGLPKADKMDFIVQKAVEMGAAGVVPVQMRRSIVKLEGDKRRKRVARWQSIAEAAAKQSKRAIVPEVHDVLSMEEAVRFAAQTADVVCVPYERMADEKGTGTRALLETLQPGQTAAVFIGPEGGFEEAEVAAILKNGGHTLSLGRRILRTETAALAFLSFLIYRFELD